MSSRPAQARRALEQVCSGRDLDSMEEVYSPEFVDHVNDFEYRGIRGARRSVALYRKLFPDLRFTSRNKSATNNASCPAGR
jgi:hypothetical protein